jgi:hypothetical protein
MDSKSRKIFCIGFNKTGTTSLHKTFLSLGLTSEHSVKWTKISQIKPLDTSYFKEQCYCDGYRSDFVTLDKEFPNSLFIFNDRNITQWLRSRVKQYLRFQEIPSTREAIESRKYGWIAKDFFSEPELAIFKWLAEYRIYKHQAFTYFSKRKEFMVINITEEPNYTDTIKNLLNYNNFEYNSGIEIKAARENILDESKYDAKALNHYYKLIDRVQNKFSALGHEESN